MDVLITGISRGIGLETLRIFASNPVNRVFAVARNIGKIKELIFDSGAGRTHLIEADLAGGSFDVVYNALGDHNCGHLDIIIHNAGILIKRPFEELDEKDWLLSYRTNVIGPALLTRVLRPLMGGNLHTHMVMIGSVGGITGSVKFPGLSAYSSSKGALSILAEVLASELAGNNITVNCLALGSVQTEMLAEAFPGYRAPVTAVESAEFIHEFAVNGWRNFHGVTIPVRKSNP